MGRTLKSILPWLALGLAIGAPIAASLTSPLLAWRDPIYILAALAGIVAMALLLVQPVLFSGALPQLNTRLARTVHRTVGAIIVIAVVVHVGGLWITSPPDVIDALLFVSPTPFSVWGVIAMWLVFAMALVAWLRKRLPARLWRRLHTAFACAIAATVVLHALLIEGTMEPVSKIILSVLLCCAVAFVTYKTWRSTIATKRSV